jgi:hypothetical protein
MAATAWGSMRGLETVMGGPSLAAQMVRLGGSIGLAVLVFGLGAQLLRIREFEDVRDAVVARLRRLTGRTR